MSTAAKVISITSGKGGVGKTQTTVNLAYALAKQGRKVLILDADLGLANVNVMLGFQPASTIADVLAGNATMQDVVVHHSAGFDIIPAASGVTEIVSLEEDQRLTLLTAVGEFGGIYDFMLVDTAAGIGESVLYFNVAAEEVLVVVDTEPTSITDAYALIKVLSSQRGIKSFSILANRIPMGVDGRSVYAKLAEATDRFLHVKLRYMGAVAYDESVSDAVRSQRPYLELYPGSRTSMDLQKLAKKIISEEKNRHPQGGLQFFFQALLEGSSNG